MAINDLSDIRELLLQKGAALYGGESVTQLDHALQCAALAEKAGASAALITASLLHDLGHLVYDLAEEATERGLNNRHEERALPYLSQLFPASVTEPIRLHVEAKRYLCTIDRDYRDRLSSASQLSLTLQGGPLDLTSAKVFIDRPYAPEAVALRRWDDQAKIVGLRTPPLDHFLELATGCLL